MYSENYCINSSILLRNSTATCSGPVNLYTGLEARSCGCVNDVFLCRFYYFQHTRKQTCCFPFNGPCSPTLVECPSRFFDVFDSLNPHNISMKICTLHLQEADRHETIIENDLYKGPRSRKVNFFIQ